MKSWTTLAVSALLSLFVATGSARADAPICRAGGGTPYCWYTGPVAQVYVNFHNAILLYFDTPFDLNDPEDVGYIGITRPEAGAILMNDTPDFAKAAFATMLAAQARGAVVTVQMRGVIYGGYAKIDRIWIHE